MRHYSIFSIFILLLFTGCRTHKIQQKTTGSEEDVILNSINDFSNSHLFKKGKFFIVFCKSINDELFEVSIMEDSENKYIYSKNKKIQENKLPTTSYEISNRLFVWWEKDKLANSKTFYLLQKYDMLKDDEDGQIKYWDPVLIEKRKVTYYYICKNNFSNYQRIVTNRGDIKHSIICR